MLIPRFTLRWLLGLTTLCAGVSLILAAAIRGEMWGIGVAVGLASIAVLALLHVFTFSVTLLFSSVHRALFRRRAGVSPFATPVTTSPLDSPGAETPPPLTG